MLFFDLLLLVRTVWTVIGAARVLVTTVRGLFVGGNILVLELLFDKNFLFVLFCVVFFWNVAYFIQNLLKLIHIVFK